MLRSPPIETLIDPGDVILTEDFTYSGTLYQMRRFRADVRGVACDNEGFLPDALAATIQKVRTEGKQPKFIYNVPTFQNPQGWTMSLARRKALIALAQQYDIPMASHIEEISDIQRAKRDAMISGLEAHFSQGAIWAKPEGGLSLWVKSPVGTDVTPMREKVLAHYDVGYVPGSNLAPDGVSGKNCMRLK